MRVGVVGVGNMGRPYADAIRRHRRTGARGALHPDARQDPGPAGAEVRGPPEHDRLGSRGRGRDRHAALEPSRRGDRCAPAGLHVLTDKPLAVHVADGRRMLAAHTDTRLRFGVIFNERTRPVTAKIRAMIEAGELGELRRVIWLATGDLPLARLLRERRLARDLGGRGRGRHHQPGLPRPRPPAVVRGVSRPGHREDRSRQVPPHRGRGRRQRAARVSGRRDRALRRDHRRDAGHEPGGDRRRQGQARAGYRELEAQVLPERGVRRRVQPDARAERFDRPPVAEIDVPAAPEADRESHVVILENFRDAIREGVADPRPGGGGDPVAGARERDAPVGAPGAGRRSPDRRRADGAGAPAPRRPAGRRSSARPAPRPPARRGGGRRGAGRRGAPGRTRWRRSRS